MYTDARTCTCTYTARVRTPLLQQQPDPERLWDYVWLYRQTLRSISEVRRGYKIQRQSMARATAGPLKLD